jgi:hypothetical protein
LTGEQEADEEHEGTFFESLNGNAPQPARDCLDHFRASSFNGA